MGETAMNTTTNDLSLSRCRPYDKGEPPLNTNEIAKLTQLVPNWSVVDGSPVLERVFGFNNYYETMAFVNTAAWVAHQQDHHPDISFGYKNCRIAYTTHSVGGLSENDFICAARIDLLLE
jgi:4a-hydroxytetrahydrobiopterin dehydratase